MVGKDEGTYFMGGMIDIICREEEVDRGSIKSAKEAEYMITGQERMLAIHFSTNSNWERYGDVIEKYDQDYLGGINKYPTTLHGAYILLKNWTQKPARKVQRSTSLGYPSIPMEKAM